MQRVRCLQIFIIALACCFIACSKKPAVQPAQKFDPETSFTTANELLEKKEYEKARASFLEVKNRDQTRKFAPLAQLKIADSYVKEEEPELAVAEYRKFLDAYPDHQYASYAQYQIAMVYFDQIESPERGYGGAAKSLEEFEKLKKMFPRNPYKEAVDLKIEKCRNTIAEYEYLVGKFYYKKGSYQAALGRFDGLLKKYPGYQGASDVLYYTAMSYKNLGNAERALEYLSLFIERYPSHKLVKDAQKEIASLSRK
ncbi:MAG: hypothetical protein AMK74_01720 [Nitrospira bacterium SM23_35]|jgi:outer membrane protein assembly factor BamD|nr:MAG: hypothetical protein AMK74_01720 [Nitrospira bacterium SM23_35]